MSGWIKLHRQFKDNGHFHMPDRALKIWLYILLSVSHKDRPEAGLRAGEAWISYDMIARDCGDSPNRHMRREAVAQALKYLEENGYIERFITKGKGQRIRVVNWSKYQGGDVASSDTEPARTTSSENGPRDDSPVPITDHTSSVNGPHQFRKRTTPVPITNHTGSETEPIQEVKEQEEVGEGENDRSTSLFPVDVGSEFRPDPEMQKVANHYRDVTNGVLGPSMLDRFEFWIHDLKMTADVVCAAIDEALRQKVTRISYIDAIVRNWHNDGIRTMADLRARKRNPTDKKTDKKTDTKTAKLAALFRQKADEMEAERGVKGA